MKRLDEVKRLLGTEDTINKVIQVMPITHNESVVILQFNGWAVQLYKDGKYIVTGTDGG